MSDIDVVANAARVLALLDEVEERLEAIREWADELIAREEAKQRADQGP